MLTFGMLTFGMLTFRVLTFGVLTFRVLTFGVLTFGSAKGYLDSHTFFQEVVRQTEDRYFHSKGWSIIGQIIVHRLCWDSIKKRFNKSAMGIFKKLKKVGFDEWEEKYK